MLRGSRAETQVPLSVSYKGGVPGVLRGHPDQREFTGGVYADLPVRWVRQSDGEGAERRRRRADPGQPSK
jgi:hypothetical protein